MAKIDTVLTALEQGYSDPIVAAGTSWVSDNDMENLHVRRKKTGVAQHRLWYLSITESGKTPTTFWGHRISECLKKALIWKGLPPTNKRKKAD